MNKRTFRFLAGFCTIAVAGICATTALAQTSEVKEKPPMYSYLGNWAIPRAQWAEMEKNTAADEKVLSKALASGTLVAYGHDTYLVHEVDGPTHDDWWSAMSMAGILNVLEQFYQSGTTTVPVLGSATKHYDNIYVSKYYNWHSGTFKNAYTHVSSYKLKEHVAEDAVDTLSKSLIVPLLEKLLADGTLHEYEIDTQAIHSDAPGTFLIVYIAASADGLDKVNAAIEQTLKSNPLDGPAFGSMTNSGAHRDYLARTSATYK